MKWFLILAVHFLRTLADLLRSGSSKTVIAQQISYALGLDLDKDLVRRVLAAHYNPLRAG